MPAWLSAYGEGEEVSESAINKLREMMSINTYSSDILTHDSFHQCIILKGCGLTQGASAKTLTLLCSNLTSSCDDLEGLL